MRFIYVADFAVPNWKGHPDFARERPHPSSGSRICQGADHGERAERKPKRGLGAEPAAGSTGRASVRVRGSAPLMLKAFCIFSYKKSGQKLRI